MDKFWFVSVKYQGNNRWIMNHRKYSRDQIKAIKAKYGTQGTTKKIDGGYERCIHCGRDDATFKHARNVGGGKVYGVRCIRCRTHAGF